METRFDYYGLPVIVIHNHRYAVAFSEYRAETAAREKIRVNICQLPVEFLDKYTVLSKTTINVLKENNLARDLFGLIDRKEDFVEDVLMLRNRAEVLSGENLEYTLEDFEDWGWDLSDLIAWLIKARNCRLQDPKDFLKNVLFYFLGKKG